MNKTIKLTQLQVDEILDLLENVRVELEQLEDQLDWYCTSVTERVIQMIEELELEIARQRE